MPPMEWICGVGIIFWILFDFFYPYFFTPLPALPNSSCAWQLYAVRWPLYTMAWISILAPQSVRWPSQHCAPTMTGVMKMYKSIGITLGT
jgi:hypothetical protein